MARILVVEDDPMLLELYSELLKGGGYEVDQAADGEEGLRLAVLGGYDLILLDVHLPKMEGPAIVEELSQNPPASSNKHIVMLTNLLHEDAIEERLKPFGVTKFLLKSSLTPEQFVDEVKNLLGTH